MSTTEIFLVAMLLVFATPYVLWRLAGDDRRAPLVVVQILAGILLGPGVLGRLQPDYYRFVFSPAVVQPLNGLAWWSAMLFVWLAGIELDLRHAWTHRRESLVTAAFALGTPLALGAGVAAAMLGFEGWSGARAQPWQYVLGVGMACAVTALPVLILLLDKLEILRQPLGQRVLRYSSLDDIAIWGVLALILMDWGRVGHQLAFLAVFALATWGLRRLMAKAASTDRWYLAVLWLLACALGADWSGLHCMVGAFLAGAVLDAEWFGHDELAAVRHHLLLLLMPVYFLGAGLRTSWDIGGTAVLVAAAALLVPAIAGKLLGLRLAGRVLGWQPGEATVIGWLLQTKGLVMIVFSNVLLDKQLISSGTFTALLLMAVASTALTMPVVGPMLGRMRGLVVKVN